MNSVFKQLIYRVRDKAHCISVKATDVDPVHRWNISNEVHSIRTTYTRSFVYRKLNVYQNDTN